MGWRRTVHCSWCGEAGHNKTSCNHRKQYAATRPGSWVDKEIKMEEARSRKPRNCSYCEAEGHTRRTCELLKRDKAEVISKRKDFIKQYEEHAKRIGLGPGALVRLPAGTRKDPFSSSLVLMITGYDPNGFDYRPQYQDITKAYNLRSAKTLRARVASYDWEPGFNMEPPKIGQQWDLSLDCMIGLMPETFMTRSHLEEGKGVDDLWNDTTNCYTQLIAPVKDVRFPEWGDMTYDLERLYKFKPRQNANTRQKWRLNIMDPSWRGLYNYGKDLPRHLMEQYNVDYDALIKYHTGKVE